MSLNPNSPSGAELPADLIAALQAAGWTGSLSPHATNDQHCPILVWAAGERPAWSDEQALWVIKALLQAGADPRSSWMNERTPLAMACWQRPTLALDMLALGLGERTNAQTLRGACNTPRCPIAVVEALLNAGAKPNQPDSNGQGFTPFLVACGSRPDILPLMLRHGALVNQAADTGWTGLMAACLHQPEAVPLLVEAGADLEAQDKDGRTPLIVACGSQPEAIPMLAAAGVNLEAPGPDQEPALVYAAKMGQATAVARLLEAGASREPLDRQPELRKILDPTVKAVLAAWDIQAALSAQTPLHTGASPIPRPRM